MAKDAKLLNKKCHTKQNAPSDDAQSSLKSVGAHLASIRSTEEETPVVRGPIRVADGEATSVGAEESSEEAFSR